MTLYSVPAEGWHVPALAQRLRQSDKDEIAAASGLDPLQGLGQSVAMSHYSYTIMEDEEPVVMYGARHVADGKGLVWLLASDALERHSIQFLRNSVEYINRLHYETGCHTLSNLTDKRNTLHHRWLRWTGFTFGPEVPIGPYSMPFYPITRVKHSCAN